MINCTRLLCSGITMEEISRYRGGGDRSAHASGVPRHMVRYASLPAPLVVWNITRACNLSCKHCYLGAEPLPADDELSFGEALALIDEMAGMGVPMLALSGGEPLSRPDVYRLCEYAVSRGVRTILSTNGTLITPQVARRIREAGFSYVGISIDGWQETHDEFRGQEGAFQRAVAGIRAVMGEGLPIGVRITVTRVNRDDLERVLDMAVREGIPRFSIFQLVYAGRGRDMVDWDMERAERRELIGYVIDKVLALNAAGARTEIVTADNYADGVYLYRHITRTQPERAAEVREILRVQAGCTAGDKLINIDYRGDVHPCPYWQHRSLGNVRDKGLAAIWSDMQDDFLRRMRDKPRHLMGRCARCSYTDICGGCRVRAEMAYGDPMAEDPACYLTEEEIHDQLQPVAKRF